MPTFAKIHSFSPWSNSADVLRLLGWPVPRAEVNLERPAEQLEQDLEAGLGDGWVVAALAQLVADEGVLGPGELVPAEDDAGVAHLAADEVAPGVGDVRVPDAEDHAHLAAEAGEEIQRVRAVRGGRVGGGVGARVGAEGPRMHVGRKVADRGGDAGVQLEEGERAGGRWSVVGLAVWSRGVGKAGAEGDEPVIARSPEGGGAIGR